MKLFVFLVVVTIAAAVELPQSLKPQPQLPENIKELIEEHINYVLNHIKKDQKHKGQQHHEGEHHAHASVEHVPQKEHQVSNHQVTGSVVNRKVILPTQIPSHVQEIVEQAHQHVPQVLNHHHQQEQQQQQPGHGEQIPHNVGGGRLDQNVPSHVQEIVGQVNQHIPQVIHHHHQQQQQEQQQQGHGHQVPLNVGVGRLDQNVPSHVQEIVGQVHQHIPQVIHQIHQQQQQQHQHEHGQQVPHNVGVSRLDQHLPSHVQEIVGQVHQHIPQVIHHQHQQQQQGQQQEHGQQLPLNVGVGRLAQSEPSLVEEIVGQVNQHIPEVIHHHHQQQQQEQQQQGHDQQVPLNVGVGRLAQSKPSLVQEIVGQVHQHIPQIIHHHHHQQQQEQEHGQHEGNVGKPNTVNVPSHVQEIVEHVHQHVPQVVNQHLATKKPEVTDKAVVHSPTIHISVPGIVPHDVADKVQKLQQHVQEVMHHAQTHIPEAIKHQLEQKEKLKEEQKHQQDKEHNHEGRAVPHVPPKVQNVVHHIHQHIPQVISHHHQLQQQQQQQHKEHQLRLRKCDFQCDRDDLSVCASNGICVHEFFNQCELSKWNCLNTEKIFHQVADSECRSHLKRRCHPSELS